MVTPSKSSKTADLRTRKIRGNRTRSEREWEEFQLHSFLSTPALIKQFLASLGCVGEAPVWATAQQSGRKSGRHLGADWNHTGHRRSVSLPTLAAEHLQEYRSPTTGGASMLAYGTDVSRRVVTSPSSWRKR